MVNLNNLFLIAYNTLLGNIHSYSVTASVNGTPISMTASYSGGTLTLKGSVTITTSPNSLFIQIYFGQYLVDSINIQAQISPGTYIVVYTLTITDDTGIINNAVGLAVTNQLKSVSVSTNASNYSISYIQDMLTFYLGYTEYPSKVTITVTFTLTNGNTVNGSYSSAPPSLPQGMNLYGAIIPVTFLPQNIVRTGLNRSPIPL